MLIFASVCPHSLNEVFEFPKQCKIDTRSKFLNLNIIFGRQALYRNLYFTLVPLYGKKLSQKTKKHFQVCLKKL